MTTKYRCICSFVTDYEKRYFGGQVISYYEYITLPLKYQVKFQKMEELEFDKKIDANEL